MDSNGLRILYCLAQCKLKGRSSSNVLGRKRYGCGHIAGQGQLDIATDGGVAENGRVPILTSNDCLRWKARLADPNISSVQRSCVVIQHDNRNTRAGQTLRIQTGAREEQAGYKYAPSRHLTVEQSGSAIPRPTHT